MGDNSADLVESLRAALRSGADPVRAVGQQRYMKSEMPFLGLTSPARRALVRPILADPALRLESREEWEGAVRRLWDEAEFREERYAALDLLRHRAYRRWHDPDVMPLVEAWWDVVDEVASHLVGGVLAGHRAEATPVVRRWASAEDSMWVRRTAILAQLRHRGETDTALLGDAIGANLEGTTYGSEFFVRKAIGWALREHSRTDADWVRAYVAAHAERLSPLSRREALRLVD